MQAKPNRVLVVEDDAAISTTLGDLLRESGYAVELVSNGREALAAMARQTPDLVLLDLQLPDMNGWSFLQARNRDQAAVPVLVVSAAGPEGLSTAQDLGAPMFLAKPFDIDDLLAEVGRLCAGPVRQCAWCGRVMDTQGGFRLHSGRKLRWATHGICPTCKKAEREALLK